jgi:molybdopterin converting factor small subunit
MPTVNPKIHVYLFGSLLNGLADHCNHPIQLELKTPSPLCEVLDLLPIPVAKVQVAMVNHSAVSRDHVVHPGDRVALFPREYAFFPDWKDFRF